MNTQVKNGDRCQHCGQAMRKDGEQRLMGHIYDQYTCLNPDCTGYESTHWRNKRALSCA